MILLHQTIQVIHEPAPSVLGILKVLSYMDCFDRANLLAHPTEYAPELIDLVHNRITISLIVLTTHQAETIGRTDRGTQALSLKHI